MKPPETGATIASAPLLSGTTRVVNNPRAILLFGASAAMISSMHVLARWLSAEVHPFEIAFFRNLVVFAMVLPFLLRGGLAAFRTNRPGLHAVRGALGIVAMLTWFYALSITPVAEATAISFTQVLFTTLGASLLLGDRLGWTRALAAAVGFVGALVILRPDTGKIDVGGLFVVVSAMFWSASLLCTKVLTRTDSPAVCVFYATCFFIPASLIPALAVWETPTLAQLWLMGMIGVLAGLAHLAAAEALRVGEATAVMPIDFTRLIFATVIGYAWLGEFPDATTWVGAAIVVSAALFITFREARLKRTPPPR